MGATIDMQRRSGNVLPPPADEFCNNSCSSSGVHHNKSSTDVCFSVHTFCLWVLFLLTKLLDSAT